MSIVLGASLLAGVPHVAFAAPPVESEKMESKIVLRHTLGLVSDANRDELKRFLSDHGDVELKAVAWDTDKVEIAEAPSSVDRDALIQDFWFILTNYGCSD